MDPEPTKAIQRIHARYAGIIPGAVRLKTIRPDATVSLMTGHASGIHPTQGQIYGRYRRLQLPLLESEAPYYCE